MSCMVGLTNGLLDYQNIVCYQQKTTLFVI